MQKRVAIYLVVVTLVCSACLGQEKHKPTAKANVDKIWADLVAGNERFVAGKPAAKDLLAKRAELATHQSPKVIVLGCADSRVPPEMLFDKGLGELFVVRSAGNFADRNGIASMEYAVEHLGSSVIVVLGHSNCGAVTAACSGSKAPTPNLQGLVDAIAPSCHKPVPSGSIDALQLSVEKNVQASSDDFLARSEILREAVKEGRLTVIHAVYDLGSGMVRRLL